MKRTLRCVLLAGTMFFCSANALAVTDKEMEEARTVTAQLYLRWANNGSGYLDELKSQPKTMAELESVLKPKEKENLKAFKAVATPKDYASWDKAKLVEYWSVTFFNSPGLNAEGKGAKNRVKSRIDKMTVSAPSAAPKAEEQKPAETAETPKEEVQPAAPEASAAAEQTPEMVLEEQVQALEQQAEAEIETEPVVEKKHSATWVYILILAVLVGVVIWLVVYAGNAMKSQNEAAASIPARDRKEEEKIKAEIARLKKENEEMRRELDALNAEKKRLMRELREAEQKPLAAVRQPNEPQVEERPQPRVSRPSNPDEIGENQIIRQPRRPVKTIYLGRVNKKGIFVCANRNFTPGSSYYKLETADGISGSFSLVDDAETWESALERPDELQNGCTGRNLSQTDGMTEIITESPGLAVFEGGCWRVSCKARVALA